MVKDRPQGEGHRFSIDRVRERFSMRQLKPTDTRVNPVDGSVRRTYFGQQSPGELELAQTSETPPVDVFKIVRGENKGQIVIKGTEDASLLQLAVKTVGEETPTQVEVDVPVDKLTAMYGNRVNAHKRVGTATVVDATVNLHEGAQNIVSADSYVEVLKAPEPLTIRALAQRSDAQSQVVVRKGNVAGIEISDTRNPLGSTLQIEQMTLVDVIDGDVESVTTNGGRVLVRNGNVGNVTTDRHPTRVEVPNGTVSNAKIVTDDQLVAETIEHREYHHGVGFTW